MGEYVPRLIRQMRDDLHRDTGLEPAVEHLLLDRYRITVANARVRLTVDYQVLPRRRVRQCGSTLAVDGAFRSRLPYERCVLLFDDPDGDGLPAPADEQPPPAGGVLAELLPAADPQTAPRKVQRAYQQLATLQTTDPTATVHLGSADQQWMVAASLGAGRLQLRLSWMVCRNSSTLRLWCKRATPFCAVSLDGVDRSEAFQGSVNAILNKLLAPGVLNASAPPPVAAPAAPARMNSVEVRRHSVIRT